MKGCALKVLGNGEFRLRGQLDFETVSALLTESEAVFAPFAEVSVDLREVSYANSAGLALLLEWMRQGGKTGRSVHFENISESLMQIARVSGLETILCDGVTPSERLWTS